MTPEEKESILEDFKKNPDESNLKDIDSEDLSQNRYTIRLTRTQVFAAIVFFIAAGLSIVLAVGYGAYRTSQIRSMTSEINSLRQSTFTQQDQILRLSKKASDLQNEIDQLTQLEQSLRRAFSVQPAKDSESKVPDGQGGPISSVIDIKQVASNLTSAQRRFSERSDSVHELQQILKNQREMFEKNGALGVFRTYSIGDSDSYSGYFDQPFNFARSTRVPEGWPASGVVTSPFGLRWGGTDFHPGMDIANDMGTPILATADGTVDFAGWNSGGYGNMVDIDHGNGMMTRYAHGSQVVVKAGQQVRKGQVIMYMGSTGFSTGPHVHYEVWVDGQRVNPVNYL